jgi:hypothetical protein
VSCPHAHQQNEPVERKHRHIVDRHIVEVSLSLLSHATMPLKFGDEAIATVVYLINRTRSKILDFQLLWNVSLIKKTQTTCSLKLLGVHVGQT